MVLPTHAGNAPKRYATIQQAAEYGHVGSRTIRRLISDGDLTAYRLSKQILRVDLAELDELMDPSTKGRA